MGGSCDEGSALWKIWEPASSSRTRYEGQSYRITGISGTDTDGSWITTQTTPDLRGWVRVKKMQASVLTQARDIIARADEIRASREATSRQTMSAMMQS